MISQGIVEINKAKNILEEYSMVETLNDEILPKITRNLVHFMPKKDKKVYKKLPQVITIYRGCHKDEAITPKGQSWTLSLKTARHFAWMHYAADDKFKYDDMKDRVVIKATIKKKDVFAYLGLIRDEKECIVNISGLKDITIVEDYDYDNLEYIYYTHLIGSVRRVYDLGERGIVNIKNFYGEITSINISDFLFPSSPQPEPTPAMTGKGMI